VASRTLLNRDDVNLDPGFGIDSTNRNQGGLTHTDDLQTAIKNLL
jgi:hypothetical protein